MCKTDAANRCVESRLTSTRHASFEQRRHLAGCRCYLAGYVSEGVQDDVVGKTGCYVWRSGVVADHWGRDRVGRAGCESDHQHNVQLSTGHGGTERPITRPCRRAVRESGSAGVAGSIPRVASGSAWADAVGGAGLAPGSGTGSGSAAGRQQLQQLLSDLPATSAASGSYPDICFSFAAPRWLPAMAGPQDSKIRPVRQPHQDANSRTGR